MYQFNWRPVFDNFDLLLKGLLLGIGIAVLALAIGSLLGLIAAFGRASGPLAITMSIRRPLCVRTSSSRASSNHGESPFQQAQSAGDGVTRGEIQQPHHHIDLDHAPGIDVDADGSVSQFGDRDCRRQ